MLYVVFSVVPHKAPVPGEVRAMSPDTPGSTDLSFRELSGSFRVCVKIHTFICFLFYCLDCD